MLVESVEIRNYRAVGDFTLPLHPKLTVLVGLNGAGKTTLLDALATPLSHLHVVVSGNKSYRKPITEHDIRNGAASCALRVQARWGDAAVSWGVTAGRGLTGVRVALDDEALREAMRPVVERARAEEGAALPLAVMFPTNRAVLDIPKRIRARHEFNRTSVYDHALHDNWNNFRLFFEWIREAEDRENEVVRRSNPRWRDPQLEGVRRAFQAMLPGFADLRVERTPQNLTMTKAGERLSVQQLSDGEKCVLSLTADLARRLVIAHPKAADPLKESAVVLVDEVELHLHPGWQRKVIPRLLATFPGCQFVLTTHSPQVISEVHHESVQLLSRDESGRFTAMAAESSYGRDSNYILRTLMDAPQRNEEVQRRLDGMFRALAEGSDLGKLREDFQTLRDDIGDDDPDLVRLDLLLRRKEAQRGA